MAPRCYITQRRKPEPMLRRHGRIALIWQKLHHTKMALHSDVHGCASHAKTWRVFTISVANWCRHAGSVRNIYFLTRRGFTVSHLDLLI